jgi:sugar (pentulose or hexulose) kinase
MNKCKLTIDLGSTEFKAAIIRNDSRLLGTAVCPLSYQKAGVNVELSINDVEAAFVSIVQGAVASADIHLSDIASIGITSQAQTFTIADETATPVMPFISWLDQRAGKTCEEMREGNIFADFANHSSFPELSANMQLCVLRHLQTKHPEIFSDKIKILPLPTYLMRLMTGAYAADCNIAAMSGLYSLKENDYWSNALSFLRLSRQNLPEVIDLGSEAAKTQPNNIAGLPQGIPVHSCGNDQTAGAYGAGLKTGDILITLGTAQIAYCCCNNMPEPATGLCHGSYPGGLFYAMFAEQGGAIISQVIEMIPAFRDFQNFASFAKKGSRDSGVHFNINSATNEAEWSDEFANLSDKALAVFVYLSQRVGKMVNDLQQICNADKDFFIAGGGTKNRLWVKLIEEKLNKKIKIIDTSPCYGVAKMMSPL